MRKIYFFLSLVLLVSSASVSARKRSLDEMRKAAATVVSVHHDGSRRSPSLVAAQMNVVREESQLSVLAGSNQFAVIANDDDFDAVLAYSDTPFDKDALSNPGLRWWLEAMNATLEQHAAAGTRPRKVSINPNYKKSVEMLLSTKWDQSKPFNNQTPTYTNNGKEEHYVTGCVATSMSQIMKYYNYPATGAGSVSYRCNMESTTGEPITKRLTVSFAGGNYDWANMLDSYKSSYTTAQGDAVAKLMYHCGVSVKMDYDRSGSGSYTFRAVDALKTNFLYNENMPFYVRDYMHIDEFSDIAYNHLSQGHPLLFGGQARSGGHEFVLDGYNEKGQFHVNWGWSGSSDGYYDLVSLNGYTSGQEMVPVFLPEVFAERHSLFCFTQSGPNIRLSLGKLTASASYAMNVDYREFTGELGLIAVSEETGKVYELAKTSQTSNGYGYDMMYYYVHPTFSGISLTKLEDGNYRVFMASKANYEATWQPFRSNENIQNSVIMTVNGSKVSITGDKDSGWMVGVEGVKATSAPAMSGTYNLAGQKVSNSKSLPHGIYVKNGRKILK